MSTITKKWTEDHIRCILRNLDSRTGLRGGELPISFDRNVHRLGCHRYHPNSEFIFSTYFFNDPRFPERAAYDVIRHEYAHYVVDEVGLKQYVPHNPRAKHHGDDWKLACRLVGANPHRCYDDEAYRFAMEHPVRTRRDIEILEQALDVPPVDIAGHIAYWNCPPLPAEERQVMEAQLKARKRIHYYLPGEQALHMQKGFGTVLDTYPSHRGQMVRLRFDSNDEQTLLSQELICVVDGKLQLPRRKKY